MCDSYEKNPGRAATQTGALEHTGQSYPARDTTIAQITNTGKKGVLFRVDAIGVEVCLTSAREISTLRELINAGDVGVTSGDLSSFGWARRTAAYVYNLRRAGIPIQTRRMRVYDGACVALYRLTLPVIEIGQCPVDDG